MEKTPEVSRSETMLSASLGAIRKRRLLAYAAREGLTSAEVLRRLIDAHIPAEAAASGAHQNDQA